MVVKTVQDSNQNARNIVRPSEQKLRDDIEKKKSVDEPKLYRFWYRFKNFGIVDFIPEYGRLFNDFVVSGFLPVPNRFYDIRVTSWVSVECFTITFLRHDRVVKELKSDMNEFYESINQVPINSLSPGVYCCAKYDDGYYRAKVERLLQNDVEVILLDVGLTAFVKRVHCLPLLNIFAALPCMAILCKVRGCNGSLVTNKLSEQLLNEFNSGKMRKMQFFIYPENEKCGQLEVHIYDARNVSLYEKFIQSTIYYTKMHNMRVSKKEKSYILNKRRQEFTADNCTADDLYLLLQPEQERVPSISTPKNSSKNEVHEFKSEEQVRDQNGQQSSSDNKCTHEKNNLRQAKHRPFRGRINYQLINKYLNSNTE